MRQKPSSLTLTAVLLAALLGASSQIGCGGNTGDQAPDTPARVAAVEVTYYYLPG